MRHSELAQALHIQKRYATVSVLLKFESHAPTPSWIQLHLLYIKILYEKYDMDLSIESSRRDKPAALDCMLHWLSLLSTGLTISLKYVVMKSDEEYNFFHGLIPNYLL